eukprot:67356_1
MIIPQTRSVFFWPMKKVVVPIMRSPRVIRSKRSSFSMVITVGMLILVIISISMNIMLLSSYLHAPEKLIGSSITNKHIKNCNKKRRTQIAVIDNPKPKQHKPKSNINIGKPSSNNDICHFNTSLVGKVYVYDLPWNMRELPRMRWYEMFNKQSHAEYNDTKQFNFGFGDPIKRGKEKDFHSTHMHSLEIILNERFKQADNYLTNDPNKALIFHIPFPFAQHFRYYHRSDHDHITGPHMDVYNLLAKTDAFQKYFKKKPHFLLYGRIAYETSRMGRMGSKFWSLKDGDISDYWHVSI